MSVVEVRPGGVTGRVVCPPSKSYTHRALVAAHLTGHRYRVLRPLVSEDTRATRRGLETLGSRIRRDRDGWTFLPPLALGPSDRTGRIDCGESGTTLRFLLALAATRSVRTRFEGAAGLARRPLEGLVLALAHAGVSVERSSARSVPVIVQGPMRAGRFSVDGAATSQYLSALLLALPTLEGDSELRVRGALVSAPYVAATEAVLKAHGIEARRSGRGWSIPGNQRFRGRAFHVPGDASSAAYLWTAGAITGGPVRVEGVDGPWPQADMLILDILRRAGAAVRRSARSAEVTGPVDQGFDVDLTDAPDLLPLAGALAAVIPRRSTLRGAPQARFKESDRRDRTMRLVRALGGTARPLGDALEVRGTRRPRRISLRGLGDHRMVMSASVAALVASGPSTIGRGESVRKSFPGFWSALRRLGAGVRPVP